MNSPSVDFFELLRVLCHHEVDFIVVGGVCAVFHGAPMTTFDLDVVQSGDPDNIERLLAALEELDAYSRLHQRKIRPNRSHLEAGGHLLLQTRFGPLDLMGSIGAGRDYDSLIRHSVTGTVREVTFKMLDMETLILTKEEAGREKDRATLPVLRATMRQKQKQDRT